MNKRKLGTVLILLGSLIAASPIAYWVIYAVHKTGYDVWTKALILFCTGTVLMSIGILGILKNRKLIFS